MIERMLFALSLLPAAAIAAQPSAPSPISAPIRDLPWGQINFLHTTDSHGWHAGHLQEPSYSADWGDYISFAKHMRDRADELGLDMLLIDSGDRVEGNGLYDASDPKGHYTFEIFNEQDIDVLCSGNHELYKRNTSENEYLKTVPNSKGNYLASNIDILNPENGELVPLAPRYRKFRTQNQGIRILAFGFLFNFRGNDNNTVVQPVRKTIEEQWFQEAIRDRDVDLFLVNGHVEIHSEEFADIYKAIREVQWDTPIQFFGGHTHIRDYKKYDSKAYALESGRYMETIGFMSIDGIKVGAKSGPHTLAKPRFGRRYIDNNLFSFHHHTGLDESNFPTEHGRNVSKSIAKARTNLRLDDRHGCAPKNYWLNRAQYPSEHSVVSLLEEHIVPDMVSDEKRKEKEHLVIINTGALRFDIFKGPFTRDTTYIVSPFTTGFRYIKDVPYDMATRVLALLNNKGPILEHAARDLPFLMLAPPEQIAMKRKITVNNGDHTERVDQAHLEGKPKLTPGYTTKDDAGEDGDDTLHSPVSYYNVPNCVQSKVGFPRDGSEPDTVDLVFLAFIQNWVILALEFLGQEYIAADTDDYMADKDFTTLISDWVEQNWDGDC
ncbi:MAG: hypothetical protein M1827_005914 [Pycnora praestabilis]|nr:MAG: hypothetical protein M1827_005914 [Pycnora praestabilis]